MQFGSFGLCREAAMLFDDRQDAGRQLARLLARYREERPIVLGLPRGGVPVALEVARFLEAPLDVLVARKLPAPGMPEYGIGAIAEGGAVYVAQGPVRDLGIGREELARIAERESAELTRRVRRYRGERPLPELAGRTVILVDDGIATGGTARAAIRALRERKPGKLVLAAPVVASQTATVLLGEVDDLVYVDAPEDFIAVGAWYRSFPQTSDEEVVACLAKVPWGRAAPQADTWSPEWSQSEDDPSADPPPEESEVLVPVGRLLLSASLGLPRAPRGMVVFAHGSGSSRKSPRNRFVARVLRERKLGTLLLDLMTAEEAGREGGGLLRFDVSLLSQRLLAAARWLSRRADAAHLPLGYFGASTGAAAALVAAAEEPERVRAVVSRGGRPDLAGERMLSLVRAPTLLLVGGRDEPVIALNRAALNALRVEKKLLVVPGATHLFEEPGTLEAVAFLAASWFERFLSPEAAAEARP